MNSPTPASTPIESFAHRVIRRAALIGLAVVFTFLLTLALLASSPSLSGSFAQANVPVAVSILAFLVLLPVVLVAVAWRFQLRSWWWIGGGYLAVAPIVAYLAIDDPVVLHPTTFDEIAPAFPGAEKSYAVLMQYSKQRPGTEAQAFDKDSKQSILGMPVSPNKPEEWTAWLKANRATIEADWANLEPQRRWIAELNTFDRWGDLGGATWDANIISFKVWRLVSQRTLHVAGLHMIDGNPDAAIATLLPMLQAGRKLQPSARSLVRFMIGIVIEKMTIQYATDIVEQSTVSAETRANLAAALAGGVRGEAGARRLVGIEYVYAVGTFLEKPIGDVLAGVEYESKLKPGVRSLLNAISPLVYNPRRTVNLMSELSREYQDLAARRELQTERSEINYTSFKPERAELIYQEKTRPHFKNFVGPILADKSWPAYGKIVRSYWELHDAREKLIARLAPAT
jgi:hypothetical protein